MATDSTSIPVYYQPEQEALRLIELPPEILTLIDADDSSLQSHQLSLKSPPPHLSLPLAAQTAVVTTHSKTWTIRQVQTSNSVFVLHPCSLHEDGSTALSIFATAPSTLETLPIAPLSFQGSPSAAGVLGPAFYLAQLIPLYTSAAYPLPIGALSKAKVYEDVPWSDAEIELAWRELRCFEVRDGSGVGVACRPSASTQLSVWEEVVKGASRNAVDMTRVFRVDELLSGEGVFEEFHRELFEAVLGRLVSETAGGVEMDKEQTVQWTARTLVMARRSGGGGADAEMLEAWRALVPEMWQDAVSMSELQKIAGGLAVPGQVGEVGQGTAGPATNKRNWHERLKRTRNS